MAIDKSPEKLWGVGFQTKESFYEYACQMVFTNALPYLKNKLNTDAEKAIRKIKQQRSSANNLLQVADYISGAINRKIQEKKDWPEYYRFINDKEMWVQVWPK
ncbi:MAG: hypothetical protein FD189_1838 [Elusimicrobia bacterium]|nr:MAG: hypothetical protein FD154_2015 [Elusimicrobiota bacterium]KAF0154516.1 MAG: hypothetical protein FD189_1838 [Elusimicrobiota bacterium]